MTRVFLNRIGTAVPDHDIHLEFVAVARAAMTDPHEQALFDRMVVMSEIEHRYSALQPAPLPRTESLDVQGLYRLDGYPATGERMAMYEQQALALACRAIDRLGIAAERETITHLVVASCTGFSAPGLDFQIMQAVGLRESVERTIVGFMGCFAAASALKLARHLVRSEPEARVLVVNLELSTLHMQDQWQIEKALSFLLWGDGCGACLVSADPVGLELGSFRSFVIPRTEGFITWNIRDQGFDMHLSGKVPGRIRRWLMEHGPVLLGHETEAAEDVWAVHAGGRSILDAVQHGLGLAPDALRNSREVLRRFGNMSSATLVFILDRIMREVSSVAGNGIAVAFGPGLTVESFRFRRPARA
ncbi:MAG: type III polyketide synthase [Acetobacteraceae bacterium]|nr:type III polyketide synthase [Acetobacteraceae bacterium]